MENENRGEISKEKLNYIELSRGNFFDILRSYDLVIREIKKEKPGYIPESISGALGYIEGRLRNEGVTIEHNKVYRDFLRRGQNIFNAIQKQRVAKRDLSSVL